eukprot:2441969-Pleurochrysis_carterae.AAC.1
MAPSVYSKKPTGKYSPVEDIKLAAAAENSLYYLTAERQGSPRPHQFIGGASNELEALLSQQQKDTAYFQAAATKALICFQIETSTPRQHQMSVAPVMS